MATPEQVPSELIAGDTWTWTRTLSDYPPSAYTGVWYFENAQQAFSVTGTTSGTAFAGTVAAATTAAYPPGRYRWRFVVTATAGGARTSVEDGWLDVQPDPAASGKRDWRTHARKVLDAIEAVIEGRATVDQKVMTIGNRSLERTPIADLLTLRDRYRNEVANQNAADAVAAGLGNPRRIYTRFGRV